MPEDATVRVFDRDWPGRPLPVMPGDFSQYLPNGSGLEPAPAVRTWDDSMESYHGFLEQAYDPVRGAPLSEPAGGTVYFNDSIAPDDLAALLRVMHVPSHEKDFVVIAGSSRKPVVERYLDQARIISKRALYGRFDAGLEAATLAAQPISMAEYVARFVDEQRLKWKDPDGIAFPRSLDGLFGGDGDGATEALCFGFMVESPPWAVFRVWSRAWLVSK